MGLGGATTAMIDAATALDGATTSLGRVGAAAGLIGVMTMVLGGNTMHMLGGATTAPREPKRETRFAGRAYFWAFYRPLLPLLR